jgi:hypothetical protein
MIPSINVYQTAQILFGMAFPAQVVMLNANNAIFQPQTAHHALHQIIFNQEALLVLHLVVEDIGLIAPIENALHVSISALLALMEIPAFHVLLHWVELQSILVRTIVYLNVE